LEPILVDDLSDFQPFEDAANRTTVMVLGKSRTPFKYPVPYITWRKISAGSVSQDDTLDDVKGKVIQKVMVAQPVDISDLTSPWLTVPNNALKGFQKIIGRSMYRAYASCCTWLNGVYWINVLRKLPNGNLLIENMNNVGKIKVEQVQTSIEPDLVYPLIRGRDVFRWHFSPSANIILTNRLDKLAGIPETEMRRKYPKTFAYLERFEKQLRQRSGYKQFFNNSDPFYSVYNVGPYTLSEWKVVWKHTGIQNSMRASVMSERAITDQKVIQVPLTNELESHYLCALVNSSLAFAVIKNYIGLDASPHIMDYLSIPKFDANNKTHTKLAELSKVCHSIALNDVDKLRITEAEIDRLAAELWGITKVELTAILETLDETSADSQDIKEGRKTDSRPLDKENEEDE